MKPRYRLTRAVHLYYTALALVILFLCSCSQGGKQTSGNDSTILVIGVMPSVDYLPIAIAEQKGFFAKPIRLVRFSSPMERDAALQTGAVDASVTDYMGAMLLQSKGTEVQLPIACQGAFRLVLGKKQQLNTLADLRGGRIGLSSNTLIEYATEHALVESGQPIPYERVEVQRIPIRLEMLRSGELDGAILPEPYASMATADGLKAIDLPSHLTSNITGLVFLSSSVKAKESALASFLVGYDQAVTYLNTHPREEWISVLQNLLGITPEVARALPLPTYTTATQPREEDLIPILNWMKGRGLVAPSYEPRGLVGLHFTD